MNYAPFLRKINQLYDLSGMYRKYVLRGGKKLLQRAISHQIGLVASELNDDYLKLRDGVTVDTLTDPEYIAALKTYTLAIQSLVSLDDTIPGSAGILEQLQLHKNKNHESKNF